MDFAPREVVSRPGLTQTEALELLQEHPEFRAGTKISSIHRRGDRWVASLLEPKVAEFPPPKDEEEEVDDGPPEEAGPKPEGPPSDDEGDEGPPSDSDGPPKPKGEGKGGEKAEISEVLHLLQTITEALGIAAPDAGLLGGPEGPPAGPPPAGPPHGAPPPPGGPPGGGKPGLFGGPKALKPGDAPPGTTPIGAPSFASVQEMASRLPTFTASSNEGLSIKEAKADLERTYGPSGYKVKQIRRDDKTGTLHALLSVR